MKKIYSFVFAAVALFSAASCQDELVNNETPTVQGEKFTITAIADAQTKTALTDEGFNSVWTPGDAIAVIDATTNGVKFTTDIQANSAEATFTSVTEFQTGGAPISMLPLVALYPYQEGLTCSFNIPAMGLNGDDIIKGITFPSAQQALKNGFDKTAAFTFANSTGAEKDALEFNNLYSLLKVTIAEEGITEVKVSATSGSLAGTVSLDRNTSKFAVVEGSSSVTLTGEFEKDGVYYICVLPGEYDGFSIALNGYTVKTKASAATFAAATVYDLGAVEYPLAKWGIKGNFEGGNSWATLMQMKDNGSTWYFLKGVRFTTDSPEFKFNKSDDTGWWIGARTATVEDNTSFKLWGDNKNITLTAVGTYDIYFSTALGRAYVSSDGSKPSDPASLWLIGDAVGGWSDKVELTGTNGVYTANNVDFIVGEFKIREFGDWDISWGKTINADEESDVLDFAGENIKIKNAGKYNVSFDLRDRVLKLTSAN